MTASHTQLLVYAFGPDASFEGGLVGALERLESGGALRILDALFVRRAPESGDVVAVDLQGGATGGSVASLLDFRLDERARARATDRALARHGDVLHRLAATLDPGDALAALLVEHVWRVALSDAVARTGGTPLADEFVDAAALADLDAELVAAAGRGALERRSPS